MKLKQGNFGQFFLFALIGSVVLGPQLVSACHSRFQGGSFLSGGVFSNLQVRPSNGNLSRDGFPPRFFSVKFFQRQAPDEKALAAKIFQVKLNVNLDVHPRIAPPGCLHTPRKFIVLRI